MYSWFILYVDFCFSLALEKPRNKCINLETKNEKKQINPSR